MPHRGYGERDEFYRLGDGIGDGKDSRSRCPDDLFALAPLVCLRLPASIPALLTRTIFHFRLMKPHRRLEQLGNFPATHHNASREEPFGLTRADKVIE